MDKKTTTIAAGIALGVTLLAGAGYGIYKYFSRKTKKNGVITTNGGIVGNGRNFIGNSLVKSKSLYEGSSSENGLIGGGLLSSRSHLVSAL
ncbi:hypothetical protein IC229_04925 [Spirosoma sp. BT702]|uniref:Uncharacterized protein n=1 Tax=Spirosoma profusum TaxID=2771354 RepID=A0A926Y1B0_9BACT|nr:hypothetical protein [Spirosoma profusum]MBD2699966.1 hypothetical protein [Spirosoma profusum]